jgi:hypothetical protein
MTETITASRLASLLGLSTRRLDQLVADHVIQRVDGGFELDTAVRQYCNFLRKDDETRAERRKLIAAQTATTTLKARRAMAGLMTRDEARAKLEPLHEKLLRIRTPGYRLFYKLERVLPEETARRIAHETLAETNALIAQARDEIYSAFADPLPVPPLDEELRRLGVAAPATDDEQTDPAPAPKPKRARGRRAEAAGG